MQCNITSNINKIALYNDLSLTVPFDISIIMKVSTPSPWYAIFCFFSYGTQYAKGRYAVRKKSVISYADIKFYFQKGLFTSRNIANVTYKVKKNRIGHVI